MYFIGVDGGGTETIGLLTKEDGVPVRTVTRGAGNIAVLGSDAARELITTLVQELLGDIPASEVGFATMAFAGAGRHREKQLIASVLSSIGINRHAIFTDAEILHYSAFRGEQGILLEAGTGSNCVIKEGDRFRQFGGWGYLLGDEGGGYDIGRMALRNLSAEAEQGHLSDLSRSLMTAFDVEQPGELISKIYAAGNRQNIIASCARIVLESAHSGDASARAIAQSAASKLLDLMLRALDILESQPPIALALAGSILEQESIVYKKLLDLIAQRNFDFNLTDINIKPENAACLYSIAKAGIY